MQTHTHTHTYLRTCLNTSPFPRQASLVSTLWSCRLLVYWCKLAGRGPSEEQRAWQRRGWWVLLLPLHPSSSSSIHSHLYPPLPVKECFQLDSPGRKSQVISWTSEGLKLGLLVVHLQKLLIKNNMRRVSFLSDPLRGWCHHIIKYFLYYIWVVFQVFWLCWAETGDGNELTGTESRLLDQITRVNRSQSAGISAAAAAALNGENATLHLFPLTDPNTLRCHVQLAALCVCVWMMNAAVYYWS